MGDSLSYLDNLLQLIIIYRASLRAGSLGRGGGAATASRRDEWSEEK